MGGVRSHSIIVHSISSCAAATASLARARQLLLEATSQSLDTVTAHLEQAIARLRELNESAAAGIVPASGELPALKREVALVTALLHHAGRFHLGWAAMLASSGPEYGLKGHLFPAPEPRRLTFDG